MSAARRRPISTAAQAAEAIWDRIEPRLRRGTERLTVVPYMAHGNRDVLIARGRVLADPPIGSVRSVEPVHRRMARMARRFITAEVPGARVVVRAGAASAEVVTDQDGYYRAELHGHGLPDDRTFHRVDVAPVDPPPVPVHVRASRAVIPSSRARRLVVSDIDDTILQSDATATASFFWTTFTGSSWTRSAFPGTAELYAGLQRGPGLDEENPIAYLSSSAWNIHDFLVAFLRRSAMPAGPLFLRALGSTGPRAAEEKAAEDRHGVHKRAYLRELLEVHADLPVVVIGDTGQRDPEIYRRLVTDHPGRIEAVLLRHVAGPERQAAVRQMYADVDVPVGVERLTTDLSRHAEAAGLVGPGWTRRVAADV